MEIVNKLKLMAENISRNNQKVIPVFPLKLKEHAQVNKSRRILLGFLFNNTDAQKEYPDGSPKRLCEMLERQAKQAGYVLNEVNPDDY